MLLRCLLLGLMVAALVGCSPKVCVTKNPCDMEPGIRYYRPKPYLLITPAGTKSEVTKTDSATKDTTKTVTSASSGSDQTVQIQLQYLPDFSEEYAINVQPGLGNAVVDITLQDGWNLTKVDQELDSNFDENVEAVSSLVKSVAGLGQPGAPNNKGNTSPSLEIEKTYTQKWVVQATNIPLGYYESVIGRDPSGKKQMYGWRYLGFMPYRQCPTTVTNSDCVDCTTNLLYGLVFDHGVMRFKALAGIQTGVQDGMIQRELINIGEVKITEKTPAEVDVDADDLNKDVTDAPATEPGAVAPRVDDSNAYFGN